MERAFRKSASSEYKQVERDAEAFDFGLVVGGSSRSDS